MSQDINFGVFVRKKREQLGMSQRQLAFKVDITPTYLSKIERGEFQPPSEDVIRSLAQHLKTDCDVLLSYANKVSSDLLEIIKKKPQFYATLLRNQKE